MPDKNMFDEAFPQDTQVGGSHYQHFIIQPWTFIRKNGLNPFQANVIKYVCRYLFKGKSIEDLQKIKHYCDLEIEHLNDAEKRNEIIYCEKCNQAHAVVVHKYDYYCAECYIFFLGLPIKTMKTIEDTNFSKRKQ